MGLSGWLTVLFVGLKLTGYITWPWIWVVSPLWITLSILLVFLVILLILKAVFDALDNR
jgi:hypothetical protein